jgi:hypothetical protein
LAYQNELLFQRGINFNNLPVWQRRGTALYWTEEETGMNPLTGESTQTLRRRVRIDEQIPLGDEYERFVRGFVAAQCRAFDLPGIPDRGSDPHNESIASTSRAARTDHSSCSCRLPATAGPLLGDSLTQIPGGHHTPSVEIGLTLGKRPLLPFQISDTIRNAFPNQRLRSDPPEPG